MDNLKVLGQLNPGATTLTDLYTVPAATQVTSSSIVICNQDVTAGTFRIAIRVGGGAINAKHYLYYDQQLLAKTTFIATIGITLAATDIVSVYASSALMSFNLFGVQVT